MDIRRIAMAGIVLAGLSLRAQSADSAASLQFEVASLKPTPTDSTAPGVITRPAGERSYHGTNMPLLNYLSVAYQVRAAQITGPDAILSEHFDLEAKAERPSTPDELHLMLQHLLEQRFQMKLRRDTKDQPAYALVVDKDGPKLAAHDPADPGSRPISFGPNGKRIGVNVTMAYFAFYLSQDLDRNVIDKTGLEGHYDFEVMWWAAGSGPIMMAPDAALTGTPPTPGMELREVGAPAGPTVFEALRKELGLRLDPIKVPVEHLTIEHIEKLTEN
jgi:uncharacterized protein (TIGR03435 family)